MIATGCHMMFSIDHLHTEEEMLKVRETLSYNLHIIWLDSRNQKMFVTPSNKDYP